MAKQGPTRLRLAVLGGHLGKGGRSVMPTLAGAIRWARRATDPLLGGSSKTGADNPVSS
jgi:hypothetical protein